MHSSQEKTKQNNNNKKNTQKNPQGTTIAGKTLQYNCLEKATNISHKINIVHSCQPFKPLLCSQKLPAMKTEQSQSGCCTHHCTVGAGSPAFKASHALFIDFVCLCKLPKVEVYTQAE